MRPALAALLAAALLALALAPARADDAPAPADIEAAVRKGADYLQKHPGTPRCEELVALTLIHAGIGSDDPSVAKHVEKVLGATPGGTYRVALAAMLLEAADRDAHQKRIAELAQELVDTQCPNGQWSYGDKTRKEDDPERPATPDPKPGAAPATPKKDGKTEVKKPRVKLAFHGANGPPRGDNSNAQFALLGLRAAEDAAVEVPQQTWTLARTFFGGNQKPDGGWGYHEAKSSDPSYGAMTCVGVASLILCDNYLRHDWAHDPGVNRGVEWVAKHFDLAKNPDDPKAEGKMSRHYYWLYSIERTGVFAKQEKLGAHAWYAEGARYLLKEQGADGSWNGSTADTCFAILFLRKATSPLHQRVYSPGGG